MRVALRVLLVFVLAASLLLLAVCALSAPPSEKYLAAPDKAAENADGLAELDRRAGEALAASKQHAEDPDAGLRAAQLLLQAADLRLQRGAIAVLDAKKDPSIGAVMTADDDVSAEIHTQVLALCTDGLASADRAAAARPNDVAVQTYRALHLSLVAWANGPARSLFAGYGGKLVSAIDQAVAADATYDHAAPLRLSGRFRSKAPWPYGDLPAAKASLTRAVELAPIAINCLFLGDALWAAGDKEAAAAQWRAATTAEGDESTRLSTPLLQELARRRLAAQTRTAK